MLACAIACMRLLAANMPKHRLDADDCLCKQVYSGRAPAPLHATTATQDENGQTAHQVQLQAQAAQGPSIGAQSGSTQTQHGTRRLQQSLAQVLHVVPAKRLRM